VLVVVWPCSHIKLRSRTSLFFCHLADNFNNIALSVLLWISPSAGTYSSLRLYACFPLLRHRFFPFSLPTDLIPDTPFFFLLFLSIKNSPVPCDSWFLTLANVRTWELTGYSPWTPFGSSSKGGSFVSANLSWPFVHVGSGVLLSVSAGLFFPGAHNEV